MKNEKTQKGITLIALIITIVVLLILAVVAIGSVQESGIIGHAQNAASTYNQAKANEIDALASYETLIEDSLKEEPVVKQKTFTLTSDTDSIFTTEFKNLFGGNYSSTPKNIAKLTYKSEEYKLVVSSGCTDTIGSTYLIYVTYYKNEDVSSNYTLRGPSGYFNDDGTSSNCYYYPHYVKGWNDANNIIGKCTCESAGPGANIYGALIEFPEFVGEWEIDTENSNDYGIQYLQGILVEK